MTQHLIYSPHFSKHLGLLEHLKKHFMTFPFLLGFFSYYIFDSLTVSHMYVGNFIPFQLLRACHFLPHFLHWNAISYMCLYLCDRWGHFMCLLKVSTEEEVCAQICLCIVYMECMPGVCTIWKHIYWPMCADLIFPFSSSSPAVQLGHFTQLSLYKPYGCPARGMCIPVSTADFWLLLIQQCQVLNS